MPGKPTPTGSPISSSESSGDLPKRPAELKLDGVDACKLLTESQMSEIKVATTVPDQFDSVDDKKQAGCFYENGNSYSYIVLPATNKGIKYWLDGTGNVTAKLVDVSGYGAAEITFTGVEKVDCAVAVDVAESQQLYVSYKPRVKKDESQQQMCANAKAAAALALETLKTRK
ncbi:hypothetical protein GCM10027200_26380 [Lentzea nigeriaca]